jgi:hypothetical protein
MRLRHSTKKKPATPWQARRAKENLNMKTNTLAAAATAGKPDSPEESHIEFLLALLRVARLRAKLAACEFDCVGVALRHHLVSYEGALAWLDDVGLLGHVGFDSEARP